MTVLKWMDACTYRQQSDLFFQYFAEPSIFLGNISRDVSNNAQKKFSTPTRVDMTQPEDCCVEKPSPLYIGFQKVIVAQQNYLLMLTKRTVDSRLGHSTSEAKTAFPHIVTNIHLADGVTRSLLLRRFTSHLTRSLLCLSPA